MANNQEMNNIVEAIKQAVPTEKIYLFGSHAYGTPNEDSDYDFFMILPDDGMLPLEAMKQARRALARVDRKTPVDILADYNSRFNERSYLNTLERKVANEGMLLYER